MKECPSCKARCFDDMEVCFGCLHRFAAETSDVEKPSVQMAHALSDSPLLGDVRKSVDLPAERRGNEEKAPSAPRVTGSIGEVSLRDEWSLRIEVPEEGEGLVIRLGRPVP